MELNLKGKRGLVFGASQGIGSAVAQAFAAAGGEVCLVARNEEKLKKVVQSLAINNSQKHSFIALDIADTNLLKNKIAMAIQEKKFDIVVNNTGGPAGGVMLEATENDFMQAFQQHIVAAQITAQMLVPEMQKNKFGRIINIISTSVKTPLPSLGVSNTIRAAMASWAKTMANELGKDGITVNNVLPGFTETARLDDLKQRASKKLNKTPDEVEKMWLYQIPAGRFAQPEEIANAVLFLASPQAQYINGINLPVDGGRTPSL